MGKKFSTELQAQRCETDRTVAGLTVAVKALNTNSPEAQFRRTIEDAIAPLAGLESQRKRITALSVPTPEAIRYFTTSIEACLGVIPSLARLSRDAEAARAIATYASFLFAKENMGIERATLTNVFAADKFLPGMLEKAISASAAQDAFLKTFLLFATAEQKTAMPELCAARPWTMPRA
jgi:methyl-accepting chemotaxis protein